MSNKVCEFIKNNWDSCIKENHETVGTLIGLPFPYTVPAVGHFDEMYYWDTYFTNKGLEIDGRYEQAKYNTDNMLYLVNQYGFMPNGNRTYYLTHSQPPFLSIMARDVYEHYKDKGWLKETYTTLEKEYDFCMEKRSSKIGLNHYDDNREIGPNDFDRITNSFINRIGTLPDAPSDNIPKHYLSICESGWDICPRFDCETYNFAPVDLNSLLYMHEENMSYFADELANGETKKWKDRAFKRKEAMFKYMLDQDGVLLDYNFITGKLSRVFSVASYYPLFAGLADEKQAKALVDNLYRLEAEYGLLTCEKNDIKGTYQWDYPNGWACLQYIAIIGLDKYGYKEEAKRLAQKYISVVEKVFNETGNLWEKYNVVEGNINVSNEYKMPAMMGWSAGTYLAAKEYLNK